MCFNEIVYFISLGDYDVLTPYLSHRKNIMYIISSGNGKYIYYCLVTNNNNYYILKITPAYIRVNWFNGSFSIILAIA